MDKKILLVSSLSVAVIVILASFTTVVGFQTIRSSSLRASPLFSIRTKRAVDEEQEISDSDYLGKGKSIPIVPTKEDSETSSLLVFINAITRMDDKTFNCFLNLIFSHLKDKPNIDDETINEIAPLFEQLRSGPIEPITYEILQKSGSDIGYNTYCITACTGTSCPTTKPLCKIILYLWAIVITICNIFRNIFYTSILLFR